MVCAPYASSVTEPVNERWSVLIVRADVMEVPCTEAVALAICEIENPPTLRERPEIGRGFCDVEPGALDEGPPGSIVERGAVRTTSKGSEVRPLCVHTAVVPSTKQPESSCWPEKE